MAKSVQIDYPGVEVGGRCMPEVQSGPFQFCPRCATPGGQWLGGQEFRCSSCGFRFFQSVAAAVGVLIEHQGRFLFLLRAKDPSRGRLGLTGGFVDPGESLEAALKREVAEEIGGSLGPLRYLGSFPNRYLFESIEYHTCDLYFGAELACDPALLKADRNEVSELRWLTAEQVPLEELAFPSLRALWSSLSASRRSQ